MWVASASAAGALVAAGAACVAVFVSIRQQVQAQRRAMIRDRLTETTALLTAFEVVAMRQREQARFDWAREASGHVPHGSAETTTCSARGLLDPRHHFDSDRAMADLTARLYASAELLPINRATVFGHWAFAAADPKEQAHLDRSPRLGDPEIDSEMTMYQRAELVAAVIRLRKALDASHIREQDMPRSESHPMR